MRTNPTPRSKIETEPRRGLHLVDAENLAGSASVTPVEAAAVEHAFVSVASVGTLDQVVVATSHHAAIATWFAWPQTARRLIQSGPDGADLALLAVIDHERIADRFCRVTIGSGDGIFAPAAALLQSMGCEVTVVTRRDALSRQLQLAVCDVRFIDLPPAGVCAQVASVRLSA